ncbi:imelysin family protein [Roseobacteraceae bacterium S113]
MNRFCLLAALCCFPAVVSAGPSIESIATDHILPRFAALASASQALSSAAQSDCAPGSEPLKQAYGTAFDAWISASHLRFGPTEEDDRAFALAFWPDSRGATPRALTRLIAEEDPIGRAPDAYADVSIAARGFYAMEFLLFDDAFLQAGDASYRCALLQTVAADIAATSTAILADWQMTHVTVLLSPGPQALYRNDEEVLQEMLRSLSSGLQFTHESRLGRPLGTFDRPRPTRAEARRSGRSARHVALSLVSLRDLAARLAVSDPEVARKLDRQFDVALGKLALLDDPVFSGVGAPLTRVRVEVISQSVETLRAIVQSDLGPTLGVAAGFNSLDGD